MYTLICMKNKSLIIYAFSFLVVLYSCSSPKITKKDFVGLWKSGNYSSLLLNSDSTFILNNLPHTYFFKNFNNVNNIIIYGKWDFYTYNDNTHTISLTYDSRIGSDYYNLHLVKKYEFFGNLLIDLVGDGVEDFVYTVVSYKRNKQKSKVEEYSKMTYACTNGKLYGRLRSNVFEYSVNGNNYRKHIKIKYLFEEGEYFSLKYLESNPEKSFLLITKPIILDINKYQESRAKIESIEKYFDMYIVNLSYKFKDVNYSRNVYLKDIKKIENTKICNVIINIMNPKIAYIDGVYSILTNKYN